MLSLPQGGKYAAAQDAVSYALIGPVGLLSAGYPTTPAKVGEIVTLYGTGLGQTTPAYPDGQTFPSPLSLVPLPKVTLGNMNATVEGAVIVSPGFYQINIVVPQLPSGRGTGRQRERNAIAGGGFSNHPVIQNLTAPS